MSASAMSMEYWKSGEPDVPTPPFARTATLNSSSGRYPAGYRPDDELSVAVLANGGVGTSGSPDFQYSMDIAEALMEVVDDYE